MKYIVSIGYIEHEFEDPYRAIDFATTAKSTQMDNKTVQVELVKEETDG